MGVVGFDLDMTLVDSRPAVMAAFEALAGETGTLIDLVAVDSRLGIKLEDEVGYWYPAEEQAAALAIYRRHYVQLAAAHTAALPGAEQALAAVRAAGDRAVIITAKHPISVWPSLEAAGLAAAGGPGKFNAAAGGPGKFNTADEVFTHVHGPEKAAVLRKLSATAYVGDSPPDMAAAVEAGVRAVGVSTGSYGDRALYEAGADVVLDSLTGFPSWYRALATA